MLTKWLVTAGSACFFHLLAGRWRLRQPERGCGRLFGGCRRPEQVRHFRLGAGELARGGACLLGMFCVSADGVVLVVF